MKKISGIYAIINKITLKYYIGSAININERWRSHRKALRKENHYNIYLQRAWTKYGEHNFYFQIVEYVTPQDLIKKEQCWIDKTCCYKNKNGYNVARIAGSVLGCIFESTRGENHHNSKLTLEEVEYIRKRYNNGDITQKELAKKFDIIEGAVQSILENRTWQDESYIRTKIGKAKKLTKDIVDKIREEYSQENISLIKLSKKYEVSLSCIQFIIENKNWKDKNYIPPTKGRMQKLNFNKAKEIREKAEFKTRKKLAEKYDVSKSTINAILCNKLYFDPNYISRKRKEPI